MSIEWHFKVGFLFFSVQMDVNPFEQKNLVKLSNVSAIYNEVQIDFDLF